MRSQIKILLLSMALLLAGCGSSSNITVSAQNNNNPTVTVVNASIVAATGGRLTHPVGHRAEIASGGLSQDATVSLSLLDARSLAVRNAQEFVPVGQAMKLDVAGGATFTGVTTFRIPYVTTRPQVHGVYWHRADGIVVPLQHTYDAATSTFTGTLDLSNAALFQASGVRSQTTATSLVISVMDESGWFSRPAHIPWPGYNLYTYQNGNFVQVINQGTPIATVPTPGANPLMLVHGLGSDIPRFADAAAFLQSSGNFSTIYGFEYDTLSGIQTTAPKLDTAYSTIETNPTSHWMHLAHSMGTLVSRAAFENGTPAPYASSSVAFAAGPHLGSPVINKLQSDLDLFQRFVRFLVVNEVMNFRNADGTPCKVNLDDQGFTDLAAGSAALAALNTDAAGHHPKETYRTLGGDEPGYELDTADFILGIYPDDGLVFLTSANPGALIGAVQSNVVPDSHTSIVEDTVTALPIILNDLLAD